MPHEDIVEEFGNSNQGVPSRDIGSDTIRNRIQQNERFHRNQDLIDQSKLNKIGVVGLGAIGSELAIQLAIMGWNIIELWDSDKLELHNLSSTKYPERFLGYPKVTAAQNTINDYNRTCIVKTNYKLYDKISHPCNIMVACTDTIASRQIVYESWLNGNNPVLFIDVRMDALTMQIITVTPLKDKWIEYYVHDKNIEDAPCTMKHTIFCSGLAASNVVKQIFLVLMNLPYFQYEWHGFSPSDIKKDYWTVPEEDEDAETITEETPSETAGNNNTAENIAF